MPSPSPLPATTETLVVGGGISGLYAALLLARRGKRARVIERSARLGGLSGAEEFRGAPRDLGSQSLRLRLHPAALEQPLLREIHAQAPFRERPRRDVLLLGDRRLPCPPTASALASALGLRASFAAASGFLARATRRRAFAAAGRDPGARDVDVGFESFVRERVGEPAYQALYSPYAEKIWGLDPSELSQTIAGERLGAERPWSLVAGVAGRAARWIAADPSRDDDEPGRAFVAPAGGASSIVAWLEAELARAGVPIEPNRAFRPEDRARGPVLFAGDLRDLAPTSLERRGLYLVYLALPSAPLEAGAAGTYTSPDSRHWFARVTELEPEAQDRAGERILCVEIPEGAWGSGVEFSRGELFDALLAQLVWTGIAPPGARPLASHQRFLPGVYPLYRRGWLTEWRATMRRVATLGNVVPIGQQGLFLHASLDRRAAVAEAAVEHLEAGGSAAAWIEKAEAHLELGARG
jgi:NAD(P)-binding Rossmann-like domain